MNVIPALRWNMRRLGRSSLEATIPPIVRYRFLLFWLWIAFFAVFTVFSVIDSSDDDLPTRCSGRSGWVCKIAKSLLGHEFLGINPSFWPFVLFFATLTVCFLWAVVVTKRRGDGAAIRPAEAGMEIIRAYRTEFLPLSSVNKASYAAKALGLNCRLEIHLNDQRVIAVQPVLEKDAQAFVEWVCQLTSAPTPPHAEPDNPPAT